MGKGVIDRTIPTRCTIEEIVPMRSAVEGSSAMKSIGMKVVIHPNGSNIPLTRNGVIEVEEVVEESQS